MCTYIKLNKHFFYSNWILVLEKPNIPIIDIQPSRVGSCYKSNKKKVHLYLWLQRWRGERQSNHLSKLSKFVQSQKLLRGETFKVKIVKWKSPPKSPGYKTDSGKQNQLIQADFPDDHPNSVQLNKRITTLLLVTQTFSKHWRCWIVFTTTMFLDVGDVGVSYAVMRELLPGKKLDPTSVKTLIVNTRRGIHDNRTKRPTAGRTLFAVCRLPPASVPAATRSQDNLLDSVSTLCRYCHLAAKVYNIINDHGSGKWWESFSI